MTYRMMIASSALDAYNNTNDEAYLVLYQLMWYGGSS
jgi:hypothetical protein